MSYRDWLPEIGIGVGVLIAFLLALNFAELASERNIYKKQEIQQNTAAKQSADQPPVEPQVRVPPLPGTDTPAVKHDETSSQDGQAKANEQLVWGDTFAQWAMALTGIAALLVSIWAVRLLRDTLKLTRATLGEAEKATKATEAAVAVTQDTAIQQLRAYISAKPIQICNVGTEKKILIKYKLFNHGQTPAREVHQFSLMTIAPYPRGEAFRISNEFPPIGPSTTISWPADNDEYGIASFPILLTEQQMLLITRQGHRIYLAIAVRYIECFGKLRTSQCFGSIRTETVNEAARCRPDAWIDCTLEYENEGNEYT